MDGPLIRQLAKERGTKQVQLARLLEITPSKLSKSLNGDRKFTVVETDKLRRFFGIAHPEAPPTVRRLYYRGEVSAGVWREAVEQVTSWIPSPDPHLSEDAFALKVVGDSMDRIARDGDAIVIDPRDRQLVDRKFYVVRNSDGEATFKQYREGPARFEPVSTNAEHLPIFLGHEPFVVVGRALKVVTDL